MQLITLWHLTKVIKRINIMKIFDMRFRPQTNATMDGIKNNPVYMPYCESSTFIADHPPRTLEEEVAMLKELHIHKALVVGRDVSSTLNIPSGNGSVFECVDKYPDLFLGSYGIDPIPTMKTLRSFKQALKNHKLSGAAIDPGMSRVAVDDPKYYPFYATCCEENIPMTITTGLSDGMPHISLDETAPLRIDKIATDFPELKIVISHGGYPWINETIAITIRHPNIYMDFASCSYLPHIDSYVDATNNLLMKRMLFASAHPFEYVAESLKWYEGLDFSEEARKCLMYSNAAELFNI